MSPSNFGVYLLQLLSPVGFGAGTSSACDFYTATAPQILPLLRYHLQTETETKTSKSLAFSI